MSDTEFTTERSEEQKVAGLLGELKHVQAPADFDLRLKARIASARPGRFGRSSGFRSLRFAVPVLLLVAATFAALYLSGLFAPNFMDQVSAPDAPGSSETSGQPQLSASREPDPNEFRAESTTTPANKAGVQNEQAPPSGDRVQSKPRPVTRRSAPGNSAGSVDKALTEAVTKNVKGANTSIPETDDVALKPIEVLKRIGIDTEVIGGSMTVRGLQKDSIGARSGVMSGDVIETIDGQRIDGSTILKNDAGPRSLGVRRNDKPLTLTIPEKKP